MSDNLISIRNLKKLFPIRRGLLQRTVGYVHAVDGVSLDIPRGKVLGIVGESGCGKSTVARLALNLLEPTEGQIFFDGVELTGADARTKKQLCSRMNMVFQDPFGSLNPRMNVAQIVAEPMQAYGTCKTKAEELDRVVSLIESCGLFAEQIYRYPHQFSGGQRQRICIARALAANPEFIVCDEAVSALDVSIQAQIINLLLDLKDAHNLTYMFISHDLSIVRFISDEVAVMYLGEVVEHASKEEIFENPCHPYTKALLSAAPDFDADEEHTSDRIVLEGDIPSPSDPPAGCRFHTRCPNATEQCAQCAPSRTEVKPGHFVCCHLFSEH